MKQVGALAGPIAAAVILPINIKIPSLDDSKKLTENQRYQLRPLMKNLLLLWNCSCISEEIDEMNIIKHR